MTTPQDAIAARRKLTNKLIAGKAAARLAPFFYPKVVLIAGDGSLLIEPVAMPQVQIDRHRQGREPDEKRRNEQAEVHQRTRLRASRRSR